MVLSAATAKPVGLLRYFGSVLKVCRVGPHQGTWVEPGKGVGTGGVPITSVSVGAGDGVTGEGSAGWSVGEDYTVCEEAQALQVSARINKTETHKYFIFIAPLQIQKGFGGYVYCQVCLFPG